LARLDGTNGRRAAHRWQFAPLRRCRGREIKLRELQKNDPTAWLKPLEPGPRTINKCLGILTTIGFYASGHHLAVKNVAERIEKLPTGEDDEEGESGVIEENILTPGELGRVIDAAVDPYRVPIALAGYCGLRQAEVLGLQWADIDWHRGTAEIRRTMRRGVFSKPKSKASRRTIELPRPLDELERWRQGARQCIHHAQDLYPCHTEGEAGNERSDGRTHRHQCEEWKQNGNKRDRRGSAALGEPSASSCFGGEAGMALGTSMCLALRAAFGRAKLLSCSFVEPSGSRSYPNLACRK
jgi:integrase